MEEVGGGWQRFGEREGGQGGNRAAPPGEGHGLIAIEKVIGDMLSKVIPTYVRARRPTHCLLQFLIKSGDISREQFGDCVSFHVVCRLLLPSHGASEQHTAPINRDGIHHADSAKSVPSFAGSRPLRTSLHTTIPQNQQD